MVFCCARKGPLLSPHWNAIHRKTSMTPETMIKPSMK